MTYGELVEVVAGQVERLHINVSDGQYGFVAAQLIEALRGAMVPVGYTRDEPEYELRPLFGPLPTPEGKPCN